MSWKKLKVAFCQSALIKSLSCKKHTENLSKFPLSKYIAKQKTKNSDQSARFNVQYFYYYKE